jgi:hypothetical protein
MPVRSRFTRAKIDVDGDDFLGSLKHESADLALPRSTWFLLGRHPKLG